MQEKINIWNELKEAGAVFLINTDNKNYFSVPDNYFTNLTGDILTHVFIKSLPAINPYTVPAAYFDNLPDIVLEKISVLKNISVPGADEKNLYAVPDGYFNNLADDILKKIKVSTTDPVQKELEEISPFLSTISKTNVYSVPENYFSELNPFPAAERSVKPQAKIISIGNTTRKWMRYAVAACIAAIVFTGGYFYFFNEPKNDVIPSFAKMDVQKEISGLSDDEIVNYLKDNNNIAVYTNDDQQQMDIQGMLQNISDDEIQQYLNEDPESTESGEGI